eukprot:8832778-Ditylum_brightwellii.AAC.1
MRVGATLARARGGSRTIPACLMRGRERVVVGLVVERSSGVVKPSEPMWAMVVIRQPVGDFTSSTSCGLELSCVHS